MTDVVTYESKRGQVSYGLRAGTSSDEAFLFDAWVRCIRRVPPIKDWSPDHVRLHRQRVLEPTLARCGAVIAHHPDNPELIVGVAVAEVGLEGDAVLHLLYVKEALRGFGVGRRLLRTAAPTLGTVYVSHAARGLPALCRKWGLVYDPYTAQGVS